MNKRSSASARIAAVVVLILAFVVVVVLLGGALGGDSGGSGGDGRSKSGRHAQRSERKTPKAYVVESGDTLISIAHRTGVTVARIEELNPEVDPQILIAGETLKLR